MPTEEYSWIIMDSYEVLQAYQKYQNCEDKTFPRGAKEFKCVKVMAGPYDLEVFTKKNKKYLNDWRKEVKSGVDREFTLYFFNTNHKHPEFFLRLDDFVKDCLGGVKL